MGPAQQVKSAAATMPAQIGDHSPSDKLLTRRLYLVLCAAALAFAFFAGLNTIGDPDFFWQLATGRWVAQHHSVFSTDVFSYTAPGQPWVYPVGSALIFYWTYLFGGWTLLSWMGALASCLTVALLIRKSTIATVALAILSIPLVSERTIPRAEMFTVVLFSAFLSLLWENYTTGRARLFWLPLLMLGWVNFHLGFVAGLALIGAFVGLDVLQMARPGVQRDAALARLRRSSPWYLATCAATLANPWGWNIFAAVVRQNRVSAEHSAWIAEWGAVPLSWTAISQSLPWTLRQPFYLLLAIALAAAVLALFQKKYGPAILLLAATYPGIRHVRMTALTSCVIIVVAGAILSSTIERLGERIQPARTRRLLAIAAAGAFVVLAVFQCIRVPRVDESQRWSYGTGLAWWVPEGAASFVREQKLPAEVFNTYIPGGYLVWALGPDYRDYFDGRAIPFGTEAFRREAEMLQSPPDAPVWQAEIDRYNIKTLVLPVNRFEAVLSALKIYCDSPTWQPVYLDDVSAVFVRRTPQTESLVDRLQINCATAPLSQASAGGSAAEQFNHWTNRAAILAALGRNSEALFAAKRAEEIVPDSSFVSWLRGNVYFSMGRRSDAEREYLKAIDEKPGIPLFWFALATVYKHEGNIPDTIRAQRQAIDLSTMAQPFELLKLARLYLDTQQPQAALDAFDEALHGASPELLAASGVHSLRFQIDQGKAAAYRAMGDLKQAATFDQKAVQDLVPQN